MKIKTEYNIGDKVTINDYVEKLVPCSACKGSGIVTLHGSDFVCPSCHGNKEKLITTYEPITIDITKILIEVDNTNHISFKYISDHDDNYGCTDKPRDYHYFTR